MKDHKETNKNDESNFDTWVYVMYVPRSITLCKCTQIRKIWLLILLLWWCFFANEKCFSGVDEKMFLCGWKNVSVRYCFWISWLPLLKVSKKVVAVWRFWYNCQQFGRLRNIRATLQCQGVWLLQLYYGRQENIFCNSSSFQVLMKHNRLKNRYRWIT